MKRTSHPLDKEFNTEEDVVMEDDISVEIPENAQLRDVADLALEDYKQTKENMLYIEPSARAKMLQLMNDFLTTAKDALDKIEKNKIQYMKAEKAMAGKTKDGKPAESGSQSGGFSRAQLESGNVSVEKGQLKLVNDQ